MDSQQTTAVCTVITQNRIAYARSLFDSVRQHNSGLTCFALVIDPAANGAGLDKTDFEVINLQSLETVHESHRLFQYTPFELCCALKPFVLRYLVEKRGFDFAIYLDSDILVLAPLDRLIQQFEHSDILVTPHLDTPFPVDGKKPDDAHLMLSGVFNLGFIGVKNAPTGIAFLRWWQGKLENGCIQDHFNGIFVDQKYVDLAVGLFDGLGIVRDPGCNVAYWNLHSRKISRAGDQWLVNGVPLVFYHFSDFDPSQPEVISGHQDRFDLAALPDLQALFYDYCERLEKHGLKQTQSLPYGYARYLNGRRISPASRRAYLLCRPESRPKNPFDRKSHTLTFKVATCKQWCWLQLNRLAHRLLKH